MKIARVVLSALVVLTVVVSLIGFVPSNRWYIQMMSVPRLQYSIGLAVCTVLIAVTLYARDARDEATSWTVTVGRVGFAAGALALIVNVWPLLPYTVGSVEDSECAWDQRLVVMVSNVKLGNENTQPLVDLVREVQPDLLLTMETDEVWDEALGELDDAYPHSIQHITGSYYGIHLQSRFPLREADVDYPGSVDTPVIQTAVELPSGDSVRFVGIHPKPPHWNQPSVYRDGQLAAAALEADKDGYPTVIAGDFNAVSWSPIFELVQAVGGLVDPRQQAGYLASHSADSWLMHWPLDHVIHQPEIRTVSFRIERDIGSDHYPVVAELCLDGSGQRPPQQQDSDLRLARQAVETARNAPPSDSAEN